MTIEEAEAHTGANIIKLGDNAYGFEWEAPLQRAAWSGRLEIIVKLAKALREKRLGMNRRP
jgi:hypothetical protein